MRRTRQIRSKWLTIRLSEDEEKKLIKFYNRTTSSSISEYARNVLLNEPITILYRNQSADEFMTEMIMLKNELNAIGKNFNQVVHKFHTLNHIPEIKVWAVTNEASQKHFLHKVDEIREKMNKIYEQWSQK